MRHHLAPRLPTNSLPLPLKPIRQYPGLQAAVAADLATMLTLADASHRLFPATSWRWLFEELRRRGFAVFPRASCARANHLQAASCFLAGQRSLAWVAAVQIVTKNWGHVCAACNDDY